MREKIQKVLAHAGIASRRQIEAMIQEGRIKINGHLAKLGDRIALTDQILIDTRPVKLLKSVDKKIRVLLYNKPEGQISTRSDPGKRETVFAHLPLLRNARWVAIGRLDINTQGLMIFTNYGELANRLMHPSYEFEREYAARIHGPVTPITIKNLMRGVRIDGAPAKFDKVIDAGGESSNRWFNIIVKEGRNRLVRKLWESQGLQVSRLIRTRFGDITLPRGLKRGQWTELNFKDVQLLLKAVDLL